MRFQSILKYFHEGEKNLTFVERILLSILAVTFSSYKCINIFCCPLEQNVNIIPFNYRSILTNCWVFWNWPSWEKTFEIVSCNNNKNYVKRSPWWWWGFHAMIQNNYLPISVTWFVIGSRRILSCCMNRNLAYFVNVPFYSVKWV